MWSYSPANSIMAHPMSAATSPRDVLRKVSSSKVTMTAYDQSHHWRRSMRHMVSCISFTGLALNSTTEPCSFILLAKRSGKRAANAPVCLADYSGLESPMLPTRFLFWHGRTVRPRPSGRRCPIGYGRSAGAGNFTPGDGCGLGRPVSNNPAILRALTLRGRNPLEVWETRKHRRAPVYLCPVRICQGLILEPLPARAWPAPRGFFSIVPCVEVSHLRELARGELQEFRHFVIDVCSVGRGRHFLPSQKLGNI